MKRGQSALEYLVTYGWAILAIVIIAALLAVSGFFNPGSLVGTSKCGGFSAFQCMDHKVGTNGNITLVMSNAVGDTVSSVYLINVTYTNGTSVTQNYYCAASLAANQRATCALSTNTVAGAVGGTSDDFRVTVNYTSSSGIGHTDSGTVKGQYQT